MNDPFKYGKIGFYVLLAMIVVIAFALNSCAPRTTRIEFSCTSTAEAEMIVTNCADPETWREWIRRQQGEL